MRAPPGHGRRLLLFCVVGAIGFVVDVSALLLVRDWLGVYAGRLLSFWVAATATWLLNRRLTFAGRNAGVGLLHEYLGYLGVMTAGAAVNYAVYSVLAWYFGHAPGQLVLYVALGALGGLCVNYPGANRIFGRGTRP